MPRYFFNVHDGHSSLDQEGIDLPSPDVARVMAIRLAGEIFRDEAERMLLGPAWRLAVLDEAGKSVFSVDVHLSTRLDGQ
ncbi:hypothetical protein SAMN02799622_05580 [Methylobacterium sp. UNC378MF]|uniref:DUF6894 family protein n=1 Tax=Methylobacterium sp. UNC378MF TaxID=1502748 RepID=UPI000884562E|nr:hypothetical protein [Methylobacterium sp. UNC378MF]SDA33641.1 hypothetical protein SAMN02799622_05580 [Methylobacterium sp. UNC378MF]